MGIVRYDTIQSIQHLDDILVFLGVYQYQDIEGLIPQDFEPQIPAEDDQSNYSDYSYGPESEIFFEQDTPVDDIGEENYFSDEPLNYIFSDLTLDYGDDIIVHRLGNFRLRRSRFDEDIEDIGERRQRPRINE